MADDAPLTEPLHFVKTLREPLWHNKTANVLKIFTPYGKD